MKKGIIFIGYNILIIVVLFLLSEIIIRIFMPEVQVQGTSGSIIADSVYNSSHGLRPLSSGKTNGVPVSIDQYGFRKSSVEIDTTKDSWLYLGDSVTFGIGVANDSIFSALVQAQIDTVNILNPSAIGYNINSYWDVFENLIIRNRHNLRIKKACIFWCLNDTYINVPDFDTPGGSLRYVLSDILRFVRSRSKLYYFLKTLIFDRPKSYFIFDKSFYQVDNSDLLYSIQILDKMNTYCREHDIEFNLFLLPYEYQLRVEDFTPQKLMRELIQNKSFVFSPFESIDTRKHKSNEFFLYGDGIHLSKLGHRYLSKFLVNNLMEN